MSAESRCVTRHFIFFGSPTPSADEILPRSMRAATQMLPGASNRGELRTYPKTRRVQMRRAGQVDRGSRAQRIETNTLRACKIIN